MIFLGYPRYQQPPITTVGSGGPVVFTTSNLSANRNSILTGNYNLFLFYNIFNNFICLHLSSFLYINIQFFQPHHLFEVQLREVQDQLNPRSHLTAPLLDMVRLTQQDFTNVKCDLT